MGRAIPYEENHRVVDGFLYKKCSRHSKLYPNEDEWFLCNDEYFYINKLNGIDGLYPYCKKCNIKSVDIWRKENSEWYKELNHKTNTNPSDKTRETYRQNGRERRRNGKHYKWLYDNPHRLVEYIKNHRIHDINTSEWNSCLEIFKYSCAYCGITEKEHKKIYNQRLHKDHVDDHGYNDLRNAVPGCKICNSAKHTFDLSEWYTKQDFFDQDKYNKIQWWITEGYKNYIVDKPPYRVFRKKNEGLKTFHWELWSVDEQRNIIQLIAKENKKKDLTIHIDNYLLNR